MTRNFQQNLLIVLALGLCVLCVYQWRGETVQRNEIATLNQAVYEKSRAIQGYTNSIATLDHQVAELTTRMAELGQSAQTNEQLLAEQRSEVRKLQITNEGLTNQIGDYKKAVNTLEARLKEAYAGVQKQNDALKELVTQRDEFVRKFNDSVKERNDVVTKYNDLAVQVEKLQGGPKKQ